MTRLLITGATGFIGANLVRKLSSLNYQVWGISKGGGMVDDTFIDAVDCTNLEALRNYCSGKSFDGIIHLAAIVPASFYGEEAKQSLHQNVKMTQNLLMVFGKQVKGAFIYVSGSSVYGSPERLPVTEEVVCMASLEDIGDYPLGKYLGELYCKQCQRELNLPVAILRISAPYGPGMRKETVLSKFIKKALLSEDLTLYGTGERSQDFIYIEDITDAILQAYKTKATGIFNVSSGTSTSMKELAVIILDVLPSSKSKIVYNNTVDPQESYRASFSFEKARQVFGYKPKYTLRQGIQEYAEIIKKEMGL